MLGKNKSNPLSLVKALTFLDSKKWSKQKSLGQNFLVDENILNKIVSIVKIKNKSILEIGPGTGNLTSHILKNGSKKLIVVEKDKNLSIFLKR